MPLIDSVEARPFQIHIEAAPPRVGRFDDGVGREPRIAPYALYPFQDQALGHLRGQRNAAVVSYSGAGKSMLALCAGANALADGLVERVVVLTYSARSYHVKEEVSARIGREDVLMANGPAGERWRSYHTTPARWIVVPDSMLISDADVLSALMPSSMLIIDSAAQVKNPAAARAAATRQLNENAAMSLTVLPPGGHYKKAHWEYLTTQAVDPHGASTTASLAMARRSRIDFDNMTMLTLTKHD